MKSVTALRGSTHFTLTIIAEESLLGSKQHESTLGQVRRLPNASSGQIVVNQRETGVGVIFESNNDNAAASTYLKLRLNLSSTGRQQCSLDPGSRLVLELRKSNIRKRRDGYVVEPLEEV
jgi:hypothetical protein